MMINILSYIGMSLQSEVCFWTLLGLLRTIFDATLFKVNANLKQVWAMSMPPEMPGQLQLVLRTMISGVMLVQCFTVYFYLASYIVLLYPVILEERPILLLPWLLVAAVRKLLCELMNLAMGLGICLLLGAARPACIKFVLIKLVTIMPVSYMWMLVLSYYQSLKIATSYGSFSGGPLPPTKPNYGLELELAVRRRRTKSLFCEDQVRRKLVNSLYEDPVDVLKLNSKSKKLRSITTDNSVQPSDDDDSNPISEDNSESTKPPEIAACSIRTQSPTCVVSHRLLSDRGFSIYEDWLGNEVSVPRDVDRILEQFILMMLRLGAYMKKEGIHKGTDIGTDPINIFSEIPVSRNSDVKILTRGLDNTIDTPPIGTSSRQASSYIRDYPNIFRKKQFETKFKNTIDIRHQSSSSSSSAESFGGPRINLNKNKKIIDKHQGNEMTRIKSATSTTSDYSTLLPSNIKRLEKDRTDKNTECDNHETAKENITNHPSTSPKE